jgi:GT2 family glycosyltransferase
MGTAHYMITLVIPSHNNLAYLKLAYTSLRKAGPNVPLIIYDDGSTDGTHEWLASLTDTHLTWEHFDKRIGHTVLYDRGFRDATTEYIGIMHADMVVAPNFFDLLLPRLSESHVVSARCIEPPLHGEGLEKVVKNFGMTADEFRYDDFAKFATSQTTAETLPALFAPWFINKQQYFEKVGGHDLQFAPYGWEDADIFIRMMRAGFTPVQYKDMFVYHFTQRGHKWNNGQVGNYHTDYQLQMHMCRNRFIQKWGTMIWKDEQHTPVSIPPYIKNINITNYRTGHQYEVFNLFFDNVVADNYLIKTNNKTNPNYTFHLDYNKNYDLASLQDFIMKLPFIVDEYEEGSYDYSGLLLTIHHKDL